MSSNTYDILIIGAGPMGIATAIEAKQNGLRAVVIDKGYLANSIFHFPQNMTFFSTSQKLEIGNVPFMSVREKPTRAEALEYYRRVVQHWQLEIRLHECIENVERIDNEFIVKSSKQDYTAKNVVVATGFYDTHNKLGVPGEELPKVKHYFNEPHEYLQQKVIIVGAGNSACQTALELYHKGVDVTMVIRKPHVKPSVKYWIKPNIENRIKEGSIKALFNSKIQEINPNTVIVETESGVVSLENDAVIALIGYQPNYNALKQFGISVENDAYRTPTYNTHQETNIKGLYLAGVVCGGLKTNTFLIENSIVHAKAIVEDILK